MAESDPPTSDPLDLPESPSQMINQMQRVKLRRTYWMRSEIGGREWNIPYQVLVEVEGSQ